MTSTIESPTSTLPTLTAGTRITTINGSIGSLLGFDDNGLPYVVVRRRSETEWRLVRLNGHAEMTVDHDPEEPGPTLADIGRLYIQRQQAIEEGQQRRLLELTALRTEFDTYKEKVREVALEFKAQENWCDEGFNEAMEALGLPRLVSRWRVPVEITATQTVYVTVEAEDEADAVNEAGNLDSDEFYDQADSYSWSCSDYDIGSRYDVEEDDE